jgi:NADH:ubiquinone oxidoreductase subunit D
MFTLEVIDKIIKDNKLIRDSEKINYSPKRADYYHTGQYGLKGDGHYTRLTDIDWHEKICNVFGGVNEPMFIGAVEKLYSIHIPDFIQTFGKLRDYINNNALNIKV